MSCGERLAIELRSKGYRVTPQRAVILETIAHKNGHLCAQDIYIDARRKLPGLNLATVYRTVEVLHEAEMVDLFNDGSNPALFAMRDPHHPHGHLVCRQCHAVFDIDPSVVQLKIAKNVSPYRPEYEYSIVRHVPIDPDTYAGWGMPLPGYLDKPTWLYASPHNILRWTPQTTVGENDACFETCHNTQDGPDGFFLRESDLYEEDGVTKLPDYDANIDIVIDESFPAVQ